MELCTLLTIWRGLPCCCLRQVDPGEFRRFVARHSADGGFDKEIDGAEIDALFRAIDTDASGALDRVELKAALQRLQGAAARATADLLDQAELVAELVRFVGKKQKKFEQMMATQDEQQPDLS